MKMSPPMQTIERIYPKQLDRNNEDDRNTLDIHMMRYEFAAALLSGERVLDMACGCGYGSALLAEKNPDKIVIGIDKDPEAIRYAHANYCLPNLSYLCADAETFRDPLKFGTIVSLETIEHLPRPQVLVANYARLLEPAGQIIASVPITPTMDGNPHHLHDFTKRSFFALFKSHGLLPHQEFMQVQHWQFKGLFSRKPAKQHRSEGVGLSVIEYYLKHPLYIVARTVSILRYGLSNRYLTCLFRGVENGSAPR
jgi:2-polyprenyl-3-methyl-5-hydroxy-6-metoxy-1,4-benzoquinol methylase